jgi:Transmembrane domain of unknown function (DUF3566)
VSAEPLPAAEQPGPATPRPAGVVDLGRYRGRTLAAPAVAPPPRGEASDLVPAPRSTLAGPLSSPVVVPDWRAPVRAPAARPTTAPVAFEAGELVVRRIRLGSVLRMTFGFSLCVFLVVIGAGVLIWQAITSLGVVENLESLAEDLGWVDVSFDGPAMLRAAAIGGGILVVTATFLSVIFAEAFNLLSTITGGLRAEVGPPPLRRRERRRAAKAAKREAKAAKREAKAAKREAKAAEREAKAAEPEARPEATA